MVERPELFPTSVPTIICHDCGEEMRLVGIERDAENTSLHILTFECVRGHVATSTFPN
jgi:hypothetical protein